MDGSPPGSSVHGISPNKKKGVGCHFLLQEIRQPKKQARATGPARDQLPGPEDPWGRGKLPLGTRLWGEGRREKAGAVPREKAARNEKHVVPLAGELN